ncbi:Cardiotrophin-like cytokine factor 1 [Bagarius yarrelli]|uniref:Cardiotrophin-like cytokine factor 1 n=1 Tax=Bagarius yarrelli TaxID=175774 RepID=A0A556V607_BAGYA|nr:Cardiotrophin-like cytokine factor 1 [Bagarius yarrelli]
MRDERGEKRESKQGRKTSVQKQCGSIDNMKLHQALVVLLLAAAVGCVQVADHALMLSNERSTIERTYELTKYLNHQLKEIKDTYLSYLGPPFSDPGFSPPRPNISSLAVPSAATREDLWRGLENGARLAQNQRAYSVLLSAVRELARSTLCPYLQSSLLHFCSGLSGLLGSISGLMNALGYTPTLHGNAPPSQKYTPLLSSSYQRADASGPTPLRNHASRGQSGLGGTKDGTAGYETERKRDRERERAERGRRGRRREGESWAEREEEEREEGMERWRRRRRLLSVDDENDGKQTSHSFDPNNNNNMNSNHTSSKHYFSKYGSGKDFNINSTASDAWFPTETETETSISREEESDEFQEDVPVLFSSTSLRSGRSGRPISSPHPPLSPLSLLYAYEDRVTEVDLHLSIDAPSPRPALNDFTRKVEGFWVLRELQSWLFRSAKDFTRLKKRLRV